jgi:hypothetical protein
LTAILALLANSTVVTDGAGAINFNSGLSYPAGTVGNQLKGVVSNTQIQNQSLTYFTTAWDIAGIPAYKATPSPALTSYTVGQRLHLHAHATGVLGYNTLNVNALGAYAINYTDTNGNTVPCQLLAGCNYDIEYVGGAWMVLNPLNDIAVIPQVCPKNLLINYAGGSNTFTATAQEVIMANPTTGDVVKVATYNQTCNVNTTGAGGLDTGSMAINTFYDVYAMWAPNTNGTNGTPQVSIICTLQSNTLPTLPSPYTNCTRLGTFLTDANKQPYSGHQIGRNFYFNVKYGTTLAALPVLSTAPQGSLSAWVSLTISAWCPTKALKIKLIAGQNVAANACVIIAPNNTWGGYNGTTWSMTGENSFSWSGLGSNGSASTPVEVPLEGSTIQVSMPAAGATICAYGWEDNL